jgi:hypothetical protein
MNENSFCNTPLENLLVGRQLDPHFAFIFTKINAKSQFFRLIAYIYPLCGVLLHFIRSDFDCYFKNGEVPPVDTI